jgi:hypothetical protein
VRGDEFLGRACQTVPEMPPVRNLCRGGKRATDRLGMGGRAVTHDDLHAGMLSDPCCESVGLAIRQHVNPFVSSRVDHDAGIPVTTAQREVVHAQHGWDWP